MARLRRRPLVTYEFRSGGGQLGSYIVSQFAKSNRRSSGSAQDDKGWGGILLYQVSKARPAAPGCHLFNALPEPLEAWSTQCERKQNRGAPVRSHLHRS
jgi:hypothetical protein